MQIRNLIIPCFLLSISIAAAAMEESTFVYDIFIGGNPRCATIEQRLKDLPLRKTVLLSVEDGPEFVLDRPNGERQLRCALKALQGGSHDVKALLLQDISFLKGKKEALRRVREFSRFSRQLGVRSIVVDIEPYVDEAWDCALPAKKRSIAAEYVGLLQELRKAARPLKLEAVVPWWYPVIKDVPELAPAKLYAATDGLYAMLYGDEGGPIVNGHAEMVLDHLPKTSPYFRKGQFYIALATYEARSAEHLNQEIATLQKQYKNVPGFAGVSVFKAGGPYAAPLSRFILGSVVDAKGTGLPSALVQFATTRTETNSCGHFSMRGMDKAAGDLIVTKPGYSTASQSLELAPPGQELDLPPIRLTPK